MTTNLKELLEKYKNKTATEEEMNLVKEKLEEFSLLQDQLLKEDIELTDFENSINSIDTKNIKKQVNKKFLKLVLLIFTLLMSCFLVFQFVLKPVLNTFYFNPTTKEKGAPIPSFNLVSAVYTELTQPVLRLGYVTSTNTGIGTYEIEKGYTSLMNTQNNGLFNAPTLTYTLKRNEVLPNSESEINYSPAPIWRYEDSRDINFHQDFKDQTIKKMKELPKSSGLDVALSFKEPLTIEETLKLLEADGLPGDSNYRLNWFSVDNKNINIGFDWFGTFTILSEYVGTNDPYLLSLNKKYPNLFPGAPNSSGIDNISQSLEEHFISALSYIIDEKAYLEKQESQYSDKMFKNILDEQKKNGVKINGVYLSGTPEAIIKFAEKDEVINVDIQGTELYSTFFTDN